jgi:hypothetical protein
MLLSAGIVKVRFLAVVANFPKLSHYLPCGLPVDSACLARKSYKHMIGITAIGLSLSILITNGKRPR